MHPQPSTTTTSRNEGRTTRCSRNRLSLRVQTNHERLWRAYSSASRAGTGDVFVASNSMPRSCSVSSQHVQLLATRSKSIGDSVVSSWVAAARGWTNLTGSQHRVFTARRSPLVLRYGASGVGVAVGLRKSEGVWHRIIHMMKLERRARMMAHAQ